MGLPIWTDWKKDSYDLILVIVNWLTKIVYYKPVKITINTPSFAKVIIDVVMRHHSFSNSIVTDRRLLFTSKFWSLLWNFLSIKQELLTAFYPQTNNQTERQNSMMKAYLWTFINFKQNDWARLILMADFTYNNTKNASTGYMPFKLNCEYHLRVFYKEDFDPHS